jgi:deoxyribodipyrimidine photo-lyase
MWFRRDLRDYDNAALRAALRARGGGLRVVHGRARDEMPRLAKAIGAVAVYANRDYEPDAIARHGAVAAALRAAGIDWRDRKDQVVFELGDVHTRSGGAGYDAQPVADDERVVPG